MHCEPSTIPVGDYAVKAVGVIPEPEVKEFTLEPSDKFMILASDGVWEFISSQEAVEIVNGAISNGAGAACQTLIETAAARWQEEEGDYRDDVRTNTLPSIDRSATYIIVPLHLFPFF
jgi:serine/threonine protein phosphatase PrpC